MLKEIIDDKEEAEKVLNSILKEMHIIGPVSQSALEKLSYIKLFHSDIFSKTESELMYLMGLFFKTEAPKTFIEEVYSIYSDIIEKELGSKFSPIQADAYKKIKNKKFFSFSAPTSSGKSYLFKELILNEKGDIVIVIPSRALIAEYLNSVKILVPKEILVLQFIENVNISKIVRRIFVVTPERGSEIFKYKDIFNVGLFLFDEAQLSEEQSTRGIGFDSFVRRVSKEFPDAKKVFAHPFVKNPEAQLIKHKITENCDYAAYDQNSVGKVFICMEKNSLSCFSPYFDNINERIKINNDFIEKLISNGGTILIYASKSKLYNGQYLKDYAQYLKYCPKLTDPSAKYYVDLIREYIGAGNDGTRKESIMVKLMERGVVIHHGSIPLKVRLIIEEFVRKNYAKICFATSTLIQGINMPLH